MSDAGSNVSEPSKYNYKRFWYAEFFRFRFFLLVLIHRFFRNHPDDDSESPVSYDDMLEIFNQTSVYIGKKDFKKDFWATEAFLRQQRPKYIEWQKAWKNRIKHYTPREQPVYEDVPVEGVIEKWDPKATKSAIKTIKMSPMFGADVVRLYKEANEAHPASTAVKSQAAVENLRAVVGMDIKFMLGCDLEWTFPDDAAAGPAAAGPPMAALPPAAPADDDAPPQAPPVDPGDFTKWDVLNIASLPLPAQGYVADNFKAQRSAHAGLLLCFMSPEVETAFPDQAQALFAGFQEHYQHPATVEDVRRYPSVGRNAYKEDEVRWFEATYEYLEGRLDDAERAKRMLPPKKPRRAGRSAAPSVPSPEAAAGPKKPSRAAPGNDTEDEDESVFVTPESRKRGRKAR
jgi:hypothetical protein